MRYFKNYISSFFLIASTGILTPTYAKVTLTSATPMVFSDKGVVVVEDLTRKSTAEDVYKQKDRFVKPEEIKPIKSNINY